MGYFDTNYDRKRTRNYRSSVGQSWLQRGLKSIAQTRQVAVSLTPHCELVVANAAMASHGYQSLKELYTACSSAVAGSFKKFVAQGDLGATTIGTNSGISSIGFNASADNFSVFGWRVRISGSMTNFSFQPVNILVGTVTVADRTAPIDDQEQQISSLVLDIVVFPRRTPVDILILNPGNAGGIATVQAGISGVQAAGTTTTNGCIVRNDNVNNSNMFAAIESLNARDLLARPALSGMNRDAVYDEGDEGVYTGIRDEE